MIEDIIQGSDEWKAARCGSLGASRLHEAIARTRSGWGASRENLLADLLVERLTGCPSDSFTTQAMRNGIEREPEARAAYAFEFGVDVAEIGLARHPRIKGTHCSPDGVISEFGLLEIKCCANATHLGALLGDQIPEKYIVQCQWQMCVMGRQWADLAYYSPNFPEEMRLFVRRVHRDEARIDILEEQVEEFLGELEMKLAQLRERWQEAA